MVRELSAKFHEVMRVLRSACILALALAYTAFYSIFPSATFPVSSDASFVWILLVLAVASVLGGIETGNLKEAVLSAGVAVPPGYAVVVLVVFLPAFPGLYFFELSGGPFFLVRYTFFVLALSPPLNLAGGGAGQFFRGRFP